MVLVSFCPRHAYGPSDAHIGHLSVAADTVKDSGRIIELEEFANLSATLSNTTAYYHDDNIDSEETVFLDNKAHPPMKSILRPEGIRKVGHVEFVWELDDQTIFAQDGICRQQRLVGDEWQIWELDAERGRHHPLCEGCTARAKCPQRHVTCQTKRKTSTTPLAGIKVLSIIELER